MASARELELDKIHKGNSEPKETGDIPDDWIDLAQEDSPKSTSTSSLSKQDEKLLPPGTPLSDLAIKASLGIGSPRVGHSLSEVTGAIPLAPISSASASVLPSKIGTNLPDSPKSDVDSSLSDSPKLDMDSSLSDSLKPGAGSSLSDSLKPSVASLSDPLRPGGSSNLSDTLEQEVSYSSFKKTAITHDLSLTPHLSGIDYLPPLPEKLPDSTGIKKTILEPKAVETIIAIRPESPSPVTQPKGLIQRAYPVSMRPIEIMDEPVEQKVKAEKKNPSCWEPLTQCFQSCISSLFKKTKTVEKISVPTARERQTLSI